MERTHLLPSPFLSLPNQPQGSCNFNQEKPIQDRVYCAQKTALRPCSTKVSPAGNFFTSGVVGRTTRSSQAVGRGSTTLLLPSDKAPRNASMPPYSRPSFHWIAPFKILAVGPTPASDTPDGRPFTTNSSTSTFPLTCRDATPNAASPSFDASPAGTLTTPMTYQSTFRPASPPTSLTPLRPNPHLSTSPSTTSHRRLNVSRSNIFRDTNSVAAVVASLQYSTNLIGLGS